VERRCRIISHRLPPLPSPFFQFCYIKHKYFRSHSLSVCLLCLSVSPEASLSFTFSSSFSPLSLSFFLPSSVPLFPPFSRLFLLIC